MPRSPHSGLRADAPSRHPFHTFSRDPYFFYGPTTEPIDPDDVESWPLWTLLPVEDVQLDRFDDNGRLLPLADREGGRS